MSFESPLSRQHTLSPQKPCSSNFSTRVSRFSSLHQLPYDSDLLSEIQQKYQSRVVDQVRSNFTTDVQLYKTTTPPNPEEFKFVSMPPPSPFKDRTSEITKEILMARSNRRLITGPRHKSRVEDTTQHTSQELQNIKTGMSKSRRHHQKQYTEVLAETCASFGNHKPGESNLRTRNQLFSQICPSGLATHKFHSISAKRRITVLGTETPEVSTYPFSPRTLKQLGLINQKVRASSSRVDKIQKHKNKEMNCAITQMLGQKHLSTDEFIKEYNSARLSKSKLYGQKLEELREALKFMQGDNTNVDDALEMIDVIAM